MIGGTIFQVRYLVLMEATGQDYVLSSGDLSREREGLVEKYETIGRENFAAEKELDELQTKVELFNSRGIRFFVNFGYSNIEVEGFSCCMGEMLEEGI